MKKRLMPLRGTLPGVSDLESESNWTPLRSGFDKKQNPLGLIRFFPSNTNPFFKGTLHESMFFSVSKNLFSLTAYKWRGLMKVIFHDGEAWNEKDFRTLRIKH